MPLSRARERLLRRISTRRGREAEGVVLLEGPRVLSTALEHGAELLFAVVEESRDSGFREIVSRIGDAGVELHEVTSQALADLAATESPQGILAVAREATGTGGCPRPDSRVLVLDGIQDPGNVGTLIRAAAALSVDRVLALDGTADPWSPKAVRASAGLAFRLPPDRVTWDRAHSWLAEAEVPVLVADPRGADVRTWLRSRNALGEANGAGWALVVGNEGAGARPQALAAATARLAIPLPRGVESMNVATAGAILLWALGPAREKEGGADG